MINVRKTQLLAEAKRRLNTFPSQSYVLSTLAEKGGKASFSASYGHGALVQAAQQLHQEGWLTVTATKKDLRGRPVISCVAS